MTETDVIALVLSVKIALAAVLIDLPPALFLASVIAHRQFPGRSALETLLNLPLVLPPVATGFLLLAMLAPDAPIGRFLESTTGLRLIFTWQGAALASAVVAFPLMLRSLVLGFAAIDPRYGRVARTLGAGPFEVQWRVYLPLAMPAILAGSLLAFARALGEFGATMIVAGSIPGETRTLPLDLFHRFQTGDRPGAIRLAVVSALLAYGVLALGGVMERRLRSRTSR